MSPPVQLAHARLTRRPHHLVTAAADPRPYPAHMQYRHGQLLAVTVGAELPIVAIIHHQDENPPTNDSGFTVLFSDAPMDELPEPDDPRVRTVCLHCLIDNHPEAGRGLGLAKQHGEAEYADGEWT